MEYVNKKLYNLTIIVEAISSETNCFYGKESFFVNEIGIPDVTYYIKKNFFVCELDKAVLYIDVAPKKRRKLCLDDLLCLKDGAELHVMIGSKKPRAKKAKLCN